MTDINILPVGNKLIVRPDPKKEKTESGIIIPDSAKEQVALVWGTVVAVSKDLPEFEEGQRVYYVGASGQDISIKGINYKFLEHQPVNSVVWGIEQPDLK